MALDVKTPRGYRKAWNGSPSVPVGADLIARLRAWLLRVDMGYNERFEESSERFYRMTGYIAPGRSVPAAMAGAFTDEERGAAWDEWQKCERDCYRSDLAAAIAALESAQAVPAVGQDVESRQG